MSSGPDWTDVATMMSAIGALHDCSVGCHVNANGQAHNGQLHIILIASFNVLLGSSQPATVLSESDWPNKDSDDLASWVYGGLYALDFAISKSYTQRSIAEQ